MFLMHRDALFITLAVDMEKKDGSGVKLGGGVLGGPGLGNKQTNKKKAIKKEAAEGETGTFQLG